MIAPSLQTEGKQLQRSQGVGMAIEPGRRRRPRRRLRGPVRPPDRSTGPRGPRLLRDRPADHHRRRGPGARTARHHPLGGPKSVYETPAPSLDPAIYETGVPILGICYGAQLVASSSGDGDAHGPGEYGRTKLELRGPHRCSVTGRVAEVWMSHGDCITAARRAWKRPPRPRPPAGGGLGACRVGASTASSSIPRSSTPIAARTSSSASATTSAPSPRCGARLDHRDRSRGGQGPVGGARLLCPSRAGWTEQSPLPRAQRTDDQLTLCVSSTPGPHGAARPIQRSRGRYLLDASSSTSTWSM